MNLDTLKQSKQKLVSELVEAGARFQGNACTCPFHDDRHPSAGVYQNTAGHWYFKCQVCGLHFSVVDVIARNTGQTTGEVIKGHTSDSRKPDGKSALRPKVFKTIDDLKSACRGEVEAVYQYKDPETGEPDMIVLRIKLPNDKTFRQARPCPGGFEMKAPPKPWPLYNRKRVQESDTIVIVEGEKCVHSLHEYGIIATTSPGGSSSAEYADWRPVAGKNIVIWPDNDHKGHGYARDVEQILQTLEPAPRVSLIDPANLDLQKAEDCVDYIEQAKAAGLDVRAELQGVLNKAKPRGIASSVKELLEETINGKRRALPLPWYKTSELTKALIPGTVTIFCGGPGASKSLSLLQIGASLHESGHKVAIFELEDSREYHLNRTLAQRAELPGLTNPDWIEEHPEQARAAFFEHEDFIESFGRCIWACPNSQQTLQQLFEWVEQRAKAGCRVVCVDPVTAAESVQKPWIADNSFLQGIKKLATDYGFSLILVTHPKQTVSFPDMNQLAGGAAYSRFSQTILWLENHTEKNGKIITTGGTLEGDYNRTLHILKARNSSGQGLQMAMDFDKSNLKLKEIGILIKDKKS